MLTQHQLEIGYNSWNKYAKKELNKYTSKYGMDLVNEANYVVYMASKNVSEPKMMHRKIKFECFDLVRKLYPKHKDEVNCVLLTDRIEFITQSIHYASQEPEITEIDDLIQRYPISYLTELYGAKKASEHMGMSESHLYRLCRKEKTR